MSEIQKIKPSKQPYIVFGVMLGALIILQMTVYLYKSDPGLLMFISIFLGALASIWVWIYSHAIELTSNAIGYTRLYLLRKEARFDHITRWYTFTGLKDRYGKTGPFVRLVIESSGDKGAQKLMINMKLFSSRDLKTVFDRLPASKKA